MKKADVTAVMGKEGEGITGGKELEAGREKIDDQTGTRCRA